MVFGRRKPAEPRPAPSVDWRTIREFEISARLHAKARLDRPKDRGELAVRVPADDSERAPLLPCVYFEPHCPVRMSRRAFLDENGTQVLLQREKRHDEATGEEHHVVRDAHGDQIGLIRRIPSRVPFRKHTWRIEQPGHPTLEPTRVKERRRHGRGLVVDAVALAIGLEADSFVEYARILAWHAGEELVMTSQAQGRTVIAADWFDRRLAIAYAMLGDR